MDDTTVTKTEQLLQRLTEWPKRNEDMTVDLMLRVIGADTQRAWLEKWAALDRKEPDAFTSPLYHARTNLIISSVGFMLCLRALRDVNTQAADAFVKDYWTLCDAGDSFGELLWALTEAAGLDPQLVTLPPVADA